jgi:hypothetical protein
MSTTWSAESVWAAAALADRMNSGEYLRATEWLEAYMEDDHKVVREKRKSNKEIMRDALRHPEMLTDADREVGHQALQWLRKASVIKALKGTANGFEKRLGEVLAFSSFRDTHASEMALVASQISAWRRGVYEEKMSADIVNQPLADVGQRVHAQVHVVKSIYSNNYNCWFITALTSCKHLVFFSYKNNMTTGQESKIKGTIKGFRNKSTQLNRVTVLDQ